MTSWAQRALPWSPFSDRMFSPSLTMSITSFVSESHLIQPEPLKWNEVLVLVLGVNLRLLPSSHSFSGWDVLFPQSVKTPEICAEERDAGSLTSLSQILAARRCWPTCNRSLVSRDTSDQWIWITRGGSTPGVKYMWATCSEGSWE